MLSDLKLLVLVAEDDHLAATAMETFLSWEGCDVTVVHDGLEALEAIDHAGFDVLVTDLMMPRLDGRGLILRLNTERPSLPIVVVTGNSARIGPEELQAHRWITLLTKPVEPVELIAAIRSLVLKSQDDGSANPS